MGTDLVPIARTATVAVVESKMDGWHAFGSVGPGRVFDDEGPVVQRLGGTEQWPAAELHNGVAAITVTSYGDGPDGAFVAVSGAERAKVEATYLKVAAAVRDGLTVEWFA